MGEMRGSQAWALTKWSAVTIGSVTAMLQVSRILRRELQPQLGSSSELLAVAITLSILLAASVISFKMRRGSGSLFSIRRSLRYQLVRKGIPICIHCGYDLRGQVQYNCPECGTGFDERLLGAVGAESIVPPAEESGSTPGGRTPAS